MGSHRPDSLAEPIRKNDSVQCLPMRPWNQGGTSRQQRTRDLRRATRHTEKGSWSLSLGRGDRSLQPS